MSVKFFTGLGEDVPTRGGRTVVTATPVKGTFIKTPPVIQAVPIEATTRPAPTLTPVFVSTPMLVTPIKTNPVFTPIQVSVPATLPVMFTPVVGVELSVPKENRKYSKPSVAAVYNSIFDKFNLVAEPHYNFFTDDEEINDKEVQGYKSPDELPRYIKLSWSRAPLMKFVRSDFETPDRRIKNANEVKEVKTIKRGGTDFSVNFLPVKDAKNVTANPFIAPLSIRTNIEIARPTNEASIVKSISEDLYLASNIAVPLNEIKSNIRSIEQGRPLLLDKSELVDGKFSLQRPIAGQAINLKSGHSSSPSISLASSTARRNADKSTAADDLFATVKSISRPVVKNEESASTKVTFTEPNITGLVSAVKINGASKPEHAETIMSLGSMLPAFETFMPTFSVIEREKDIPGFPAPQELTGIHYTGYVIEKYKRSLSGIFELVDEFHIDNILESTYIDTEVLYGGTYRYRMKTILCWTREQNVGVAGTDKSIAVNDTSQAKRLASSVSSYFDSDWNKNWAYSTIVDLVPPPPPDEIHVRPDSRRKRNVLTWKVPDDKQRDISGFVVFRRFVTKDKVPMSDWEQLTGILPPTNGLYFDTNVEYSEKINDVGYAYAVQTVSQHDEKSVLSDQLAAWLTQHSKETGEIPTAFISESGVDLSMHGAQSVKPVKKVYRDIIAKDIISLSGRVGGTSDVQYDNKEMIVRLESLDTGEQRELQMSIKYNNVKTITAYERSVVKTTTGKSI